MLIDNANIMWYSKMAGVIDTEWYLKRITNNIAQSICYAIILVFDVYKYYVLEIDINNTINMISTNTSE
jgi:hypothetical protein